MFNNNFEHICSMTSLTMTFLRLNWKYFTPFPSLSNVDFEQVNLNWAIKKIKRIAKKTSLV